MALDREAPALARRAVLSQTWSRAVFLHWRVDAARVAPMLPSGIRPDTFDGAAWIGLVPFELSRFRFLPLPTVPLIGEFNEINVRTYGVDADGRRGVVFLTLEAEHLVPVLVARALFGLPYRWAAIGRRTDVADRVIEYRSRRRRPDGRATGPGTRIRAVIGDDPVDTDLSRFLTARWGFHERHLGRTTWAANEHAPWPLVEARLAALNDGLLADRGFADLAGRAPDSVLAMPLQHPGFTTRFAAARRV